MRGGRQRPLTAQRQQTKTPGLFLPGTLSVPYCAASGTGYRQNSASRIMIGSGTPRSQSSAPRPNPMAYSGVLFYFFDLNNAAMGHGVPLRPADGRFRAVP